MENLEKWKFFLSSTSKDLKETRNHVAEYLRKQDFEVIRYEDNFKKNIQRDAQNICIENVGSCDFMILILDRDYGTNYKFDNNISITHAEFRAAINNKIPVLHFISSKLYEDYKNNINAINNQEKTKIKLKYAKDNRLLLFIDEIFGNKKGNYSSFYNDCDDLIIKIGERLKDLSYYIYEMIVKNQTELILNADESRQFWFNLEEMLKTKKYTESIWTRVPALGDEIHEDIAKKIPVLLKAGKHVIIRGKAGAGKTTEISRAYLEDKLESKKYLTELKLFIKLKDLSFFGLKELTIKKILNFCIERSLNKKEYPFLYDDFKIRLYLDGLDEISIDPKEDDLVDFINSNIFKNSAVISGRIETIERALKALYQNWMFSEIYEIKEWTINKATEYFLSIFKNHKNLMDSIKSDEVQKQIMPLIKNPLMGLLFAFIVTDNNYLLPIDIYDRASLFDMFLDKWIRREIIRLSIIPNEKLEKDIRLAWQIAAWEIYQSRRNLEDLFLNQLMERIKKNKNIEINDTIFKSLIMVNSNSKRVFGFVHEQFMEYLIAELFVHYSTINDPNLILYLSKTISGEINEFIKALWLKNTDENLEIIIKNFKDIYDKTLLNFEYNDKLGIQIRANIIYYWSRIPSKYLLNSIINLLKYVGNHDNHPYIRNGALFSLMRLNDKAAEEKLYKALSENEIDSSYNRRLHLEYFGDIDPDDDPPVKDNGKTTWNLSCRKLLDHILNNDNERFIYSRRIDIFTLRSLMESRNRRGPLGEDSIHRIEKSIYDALNKWEKHNDILIKAHIEFNILKELWEKLEI